MSGPATGCPEPPPGSPPSTEHDVAVVGGGPAGAAAACHLAAAGRRVLLLESQVFPRFHIGESLLPASNRVFRQLGLEERIQGAGFVRKRGASFVTGDGELSAYIDFTTCPDVPAPVTYQVPRSRFDRILLERAAEAGADVRQGCRATAVDFASSDPSGSGGTGGERTGGVTLTYRDAEGRETHTTAEVLVDASGQAGFLAKRLALRRVDPELRNVAVYAHYEGIPRPPGERSGDIRIISRRDLGWIWLIPLSGTVTSVGAVVSRRRHGEREREAPEAALQRYLAETPAAAHQVRAARRITEARIAADFCYAPRAYAGDRWLLVGDAGSFLDPVFSTGVLLALESGVEAAGAIDAALPQGNAESRVDLSPCAFVAFDRHQRRRFRVFRRFVRGFYDPAFRDLFFQPTQRFGMLDAIVSVLAGNWQPSLPDRLRIGIFFVLVAAQRRWPLAPSTHDA